MTASAGVEYSPPLTDTLTGLIRFDWTYTGRMNTELRETNAFYREIGNFSIFNARVGVDAQNGLAVSLFANNVFNKYGLNRVASATGVPDYYVRSRPRTIGINARKSF
jgi:iron complex outermembrane receptor protein